MHYHGPDRADLANVFVLNAAFIAWQRTRPLGSACDSGKSPEICERLAALNLEQREHLARTPFLLMSLGRRGPLAIVFRRAADARSVAVRANTGRSGVAADSRRTGVSLAAGAAQSLRRAAGQRRQPGLVRTTRHVHAHGPVHADAGGPDAAGPEDGRQGRSLGQAADRRGQ